MSYQCKFIVSSRIGDAGECDSPKKHGTASRRHEGPLAADTATVAEGVQKWLDICEKEGRNGREPVTRYTLANYQCRADIMKGYAWNKELRELTKPDIIHFRSWLLERHSRDVAHKVLTSFHSMIREMVGRGVLLNDVAAGVHVGAGSRYDKSDAIPTEREYGRCSRLPIAWPTPGTRRSRKPGSDTAHALSRRGLRHAAAGVSGVAAREHKGHRRGG